MNLCSRAKHLLCYRTIWMNPLLVLSVAYLVSCMAEQMACNQRDRLNLHSRSVIVRAGGHSAVGWWSRRRLPLQQLQDGLNI